MPIPGYDPEDIDDTLEELLTKEEKQEYLTDEEWESYRSGDESLLDLLESSEIKKIFERRGKLPDSS